MSVIGRQTAANVKTDETPHTRWGESTSRLQGKVLVVDDLEANRHILAIRLAREGLEVKQAGSGQAALDMVAAEAFDLLFLDVMMPGLDGYQVLERIKADPRLRDMPVLMISAVDEVASVVRCIELGAEDYLPKPFEPVVLRARIHASLEKKRLRDHERKILEELQLERDRSERLLLNILPQAIADRLKRMDGTIADTFPEVTILFSDIVGFTDLAGRMSAVQLVDLLNDIFSKFDRLADRHGLEKIKTIGDSYMVAGGVPVPRGDHAEAIAEMALDMSESMSAFNRARGTSLAIRIGINSGPVVAGVIGTRKFSFDVWGDTVNTASRMESHGLPGHIQVSGDTERFLRDSYLLRRRGPVEIKGKGTMETWFLTGRRER